MFVKHCGYVVFSSVVMRDDFLPPHHVDTPYEREEFHQRTYRLVWFASARRASIPRIAIPIRILLLVLEPILIRVLILISLLLII